MTLSASAIINGLTLLRAYVRAKLGPQSDVGPVVTDPDSGELTVLWAHNDFTIHVDDINRLIAEGWIYRRPGGNPNLGLWVLGYREPSTEERAKQIEAGQ